MGSRIFKFFVGALFLGLSALIALVVVGRKEAYDAAIQKNYVTAVKIWMPLALLGYEDAQFNLGLSYAKGRGIKQSISKALYWYKRAAENGNAPAQYNLAEHLRIGDGIEQDYKMSLFLFRKAAEQNYQSAQNNLGMMYAEGNGTKKDLVEASKWFNLAIANGSEPAKINSERFKKEMTADQIAEAQKAAMQWLTVHRKCGSHDKQTSSNSRFDADTPSACRST